MKRLFILTLLIAGLVLIPAMGFATVAPNPDTASGVDAHSNTVVESLVVGVSDITSGNTIQVGPVGGIYEGAGSNYFDYDSAQAYTGACVLRSVQFTPTTNADYIEIYDGTSRGTHANCILDIIGATANTIYSPDFDPIEFTTGIYVHASASGQGTYSLQYRVEDESE